MLRGDQDENTLRFVAVERRACWQTKLRNVRSVTAMTNSRSCAEFKVRLLQLRSMPRQKLHDCQLQNALLYDRPHRHRASRNVRT